MCCKFNCLLNVIVICINIKCLQTFNVNFQYNYNLQMEPFNTQIHKRELNQFFDKGKRLMQTTKTKMYKIKKNINYLHMYVHILINIIALFKTK